MTIYVRRFAAIVAVLAVVYVPFGIIEWLLIGPVLQHLEAFNRTIAHSTDPARLTPLAALGPGGAVRFATSMIAQVLVMLLARTALVDVLQAAYAGEMRPLAAAYVHALRRWPAQVLAAILSAVTGGALGIVWFIGLILTGTIAAALRSIVAAIAGGVLAFALFAICVVLAAWIYIGAQLATVEVTAGGGPMTAFGYGLSVAFGGTTRMRALVAALIVGAVTIGAEIIAAVAGGLLSTLTRLTLLNFAIGTVLAILIEGLVTAFVVVYALDVKVRRQGLDLVLATA